jgi:uncharacterized protein involved in response to NO
LLDEYHSKRFYFYSPCQIYNQAVHILSLIFMPLITNSILRAVTHRRAQTDYLHLLILLMFSQRAHALSFGLYLQGLFSWTGSQSVGISIRCYQNV